MICTWLIFDAHDISFSLLQVSASCGPRDGQVSGRRSGKLHLNHKGSLLQESHALNSITKQKIYSLELVSNWLRVE